MSGVREPKRRFPRRAILIGPVDRDAVIAQLCEHFCTGRITLAEFESRVEGALVAYTDVRLAELVDDLPEVARQQVIPTTHHTKVRVLDAIIDQMRTQLLGYPPPTVTR
jgi:hypothetical protein